MDAVTNQEASPACPEHSEGTISLLRYLIVGGEILHFVQNDQFGVSLAIFVAMPLCLPVPHPALSLRGRGFYKAFIKGKDRSGVFDTPEAGVGVGIALAKPISE